MEQDTATHISAHSTLVATKSWTAYIGIFLVALVLFGLLLPGAFLVNELLALAVLAGSAVIVTYQVLLIRSHRLYYDDVGVWMYSGILPWKKGVAGVKWRDMDEATFVPAFWSWLFKSYSIRVGHRFTKSSELLMTDMGGGREAVQTLNAYHQELIRSNKID